MSQTCRVNSPFVVVFKADGAFKAVTLEAGTTITVNADRTVQRSGLVDVLYNGMVLAAYLRDIEDRTEPA
jgi:hypothetical protein